MDRWRLDLMTANMDMVELKDFNGLEAHDGPMKTI